MAGYTKAVAVNPMPAPRNSDPITREIVFSPDNWASENITTIRLARSQTGKEEVDVVAWAACLRIAPSR